MNWFKKKFLGEQEEQNVLSIVVEETSHGFKIPADNPIGSGEDLLERESVAKGFAKQVLSIDASEGVVVGVLGPWGFGKTSFVNLARVHFEAAGATIIDFNPWMFSGAQQLVDFFFKEISAQLKLKRSSEEIGKAIEEYGSMFDNLGWLPFVGAWVERGKLASDIVAKGLKSRKESVTGPREKVRKALANVEYPIIIVIDDIDRLTLPKFGTSLS